MKTNFLLMGAHALVAEFAGARVYENNYTPVKEKRGGDEEGVTIMIDEEDKQFLPEKCGLEYPLEKEKKLLETLSDGDAELGKNILGEILEDSRLANPNQFGCVKYRAIELAILITRLGINSGFTLKTILDSDSRNLLAIKKTKNMEELTATLNGIIDDLTGQIHSFKGIQHASALRKAEQFIMENFSRKLSLEEIAKASGFSAPYFSTIFKEETGENLSKYLSRLKVEKAAALLVGTSLPLGVIAKSCGYEDRSWFSKIFKAHTGVSPRTYRKKKGAVCDKDS